MPDPLDALRTPPVPVAPDPEFAVHLRLRLTHVLRSTTSEEEAMPDALLRPELSRHGSRHGDVSYISLGVPDLARARAFYGAVLGWAFSPGRVESVGNQVDEVIPQVGLWSGPQPSGATAPGAVLGYRVDDIAAAVARVREHGGTAGDPREEPYGLTADCVDDQGIEFYLHQLPAAGRPAPPHGLADGDISYVTLAVADVEAARTFYGAVLGWAAVAGPSGGMQMPETTPMIGIGVGRAGRRGAILSYRVADIAATVARIREVGGRATDPAERPYGLEAECADDQGTPFYLHQLPE